jgi:hypothetical protein
MTAAGIADSFMKSWQWGRFSFSSATQLGAAVACQLRAEDETKITQITQI